MTARTDHRIDVYVPRGVDLAAELGPCGFERVVAALADRVGVPAQAFTWRPVTPTP